MVNYSRLFFSALLLVWTLSSHGYSWQDFWFRKDQQAMHLLKQGNAKDAANLFGPSAWKAVAQYRAQDYAKAEQGFRQQSGSINSYNLGNSLALQGKYREAISAYDDALQQQPNFPDATYNREIIKKLLSQQKEDNHNNQSQNQSGNSQNNQQKNSGQSNPKEQKNKSDDQSSQKDQSLPNQAKKDSSLKTEPDKKLPSTKKQEKTNDSAKGGQKPTDEQKKKLDHETDQWLGKIPDDPGGLLRRKLLRDHLMRTNHYE